MRKSQPPCEPETTSPPPKPAWLRKRLSCGDHYGQVIGLLRAGGLHTVCEEAHCPNLGECFSSGTATFMILGDVCTRNCRFCAVRHGAPLPVDPAEPQKVAEAVDRLGLTYAVITSVTRDDLLDGGAAHFAAVIRAIRDRCPRVLVEILIPDFEGNDKAVETVLEARPRVLNHNLETVPRLYARARPQAHYDRSLDLLKRAGKAGGSLVTKSGLMLGLGERPEELRQVFQDLLRVGCRTLTLGQYLAPSHNHVPVVRYIPPEEFVYWEEITRTMGFQAVASGPFVRSSFHAGEMFAGISGQDRLSGQKGQMGVGNGG